MPRLPPRRRVVVLVLVSLLAGAVVNVLVAWALLWLPAGRPLPARYVPSSKWDAPVPAGWPPPELCLVTDWPGHVTRLNSTAAGDYLQGVIQSGWPAPSMHGWQLGWVEPAPAQLSGGSAAPAMQDVRKDEWLLYLAVRVPSAPCGAASSLIRCCTRAFCAHSCSARA